MINTSVTLWDTPHIQINRKQDDLPLFKGEKREKVSLGEPLMQEIANEVFSVYAKYLGKEIDRDIKSDPNISATIFAIIGKEVGLSAKEVQQKIEVFVSENRGYVLANIRQLTRDTGLSLESIKLEEFIRLMSSSHPNDLGKKGLSKYLSRKKAITPKHIANHAIIQVAAEIFKLNITLREVFIHYSEGLISGGLACESMRVEVKREDSKQSLEIVEGFGMFVDGMIFGKFDLKMQHFPPFKIVDVSEKT